MNIETKYNVGDLVTLRTCLRLMPDKERKAVRSGERTPIPHEIIEVVANVCYGGTQIFYMCRGFATGDLIKLSEPELILFFDGMKQIMGEGEEVKHDGNV